MQIASLKNQLPDFNALQADQIESVIDQLLATSRAALARLLASDGSPSWQNLVEPLEKIDQQFERIWGPIGHLDSVRNADDWHEAYDVSMQKVTEYYTELGKMPPCLLALMV